MTWIDHTRRAVTVLLVALCLVGVPVVANATFSDRATPMLDVGTSTMATPTGITGSYSCKATGNNETVTITVNGFTDAGPSGSTYTYGLTFGSTTMDTKTSTTRTATLNGSRASDGQSSTWTVGISARLTSWTSTTGTVSVTCKAQGKDSGTF